MDSVSAAIIRNEYFCSEDQSIFTSEPAISDAAKYFQSQAQMYPQNIPAPENVPINIQNVSQTTEESGLSVSKNPGQKTLANLRKQVFEFRQQYKPVKLPCELNNTTLFNCVLDHSIGFYINFTGSLDCNKNILLVAEQKISEMYPDCKKVS